MSLLLNTQSALTHPRVVCYQLLLQKKVLLNVFAMELESALKRSAEARKSAALTARMQGAGASKAAESASALMARAVTATREDVFAACESAMAKLTGG